MKLKTQTTKSGLKYIKCLEGKELFKHFSDRFGMEATDENWKIVEILCKAHNEKFEREED